MKKQRFKILALGIVTFFAWSCATKTYYLAPEEIGKGAAVKSLYIKLNDGAEIKLMDVQLKEGKLIGFTEDKGKKEIELSSIKAVHITKSDRTLTYLYAGVAGVAAWLALGAATAPAMPPPESCPFIYSFDGTKYVFDAEPYGGAICQGLKRTEWCGLEHLRESQGLYRVLIANELDETQYTDELKLVVIDHPQEARIAPDAAGKVHTFTHLVTPLRAIQNQEKDVSSLLNKKDFRIWQSKYEEKSFRHGDDLRDELIIEFAKPLEAQKAKLLVNASTDIWGSQVAKEFLMLFGNKISDWYAEVNTLGPEYHKIMSWYLKEELYLLQVKVETPQGWKPRGIIYGGGPFVSEDKAVVLDISDVPGEILRIKLAPPTQFWNIDYLAVDYSEDLGAGSMDVVEIAPVSSEIWGDPAVCDLLMANDNRYLVMPRKGDQAELIFVAPPMKLGLDRSILLKASGFYDIHLEARGEPQTALLKKILDEPGATLEFAFKAYEKKKAKQNEK